MPGRDRGRFHSGNPTIQDGICQAVGIYGPSDKNMRKIREKLKGDKKEEVKMPGRMECMGGVQGRHCFTDSKYTPRERSIPSTPVKEHKTDKKEKIKVDKKAVHKFCEGKVVDDRSAKQDGYYVIRCKYCGRIFNGKTSSSRSKNPGYETKKNYCKDCKCFSRGVEVDHSHCIDLKYYSPRDVLPKEGKVEACRNFKKKEEYVESRGCARDHSYYGHHSGRGTSGSRMDR